MAKKNLLLEELSLRGLLSDHRQKYVVPSYQRPYEWQYEQCQALWDDLTGFFFPEDKPFDRDSDTYFMGDITAYHNPQGEDEIIDGQQRLITLTLLCRALHKVTNEENQRDLGECLWYFDEKHVPDPSRLKITWKNYGGNVDKYLTNIITLGYVQKTDTSAFAKNFKFFEDKIKELKPNQLEEFIARFLNNLRFVRRISSDADDALQMFISMNDRGKSLNIEDLFKASLCNDAYVRGGDKECQKFSSYWDILVERANALFSKEEKLTPLAFVFLIYAYLDKKWSFTWQDLKKHFSDNQCARLKNPKTLESIEQLLTFFEQIKQQSDSTFDSDTLRKISTMAQLNLPSIWYATGLFFLKEKDNSGAPFEEHFKGFIDRLMAFYLGGAAQGELFGIKLPKSLVASLDYLISGELPDIKRFSKEIITRNFTTPSLWKNRAQTLKIILQWWLMQDSQQELPTTKLQIEHIYSVALNETLPLDNCELLNCPGNLALLESGINKKVSNYRFSDKRKFYLEGGNKKSGTINRELRQLAENQSTFTEDDIVRRNGQILNAVLALLAQHNFLTD